MGRLKRGRPPSNNAAISCTPTNPSKRIKRNGFNKKSIVVTKINPKLTITKLRAKQNGVVKNKFIHSDGLVSIAVTSTRTNRSTVLPKKKSFQCQICYKTFIGANDLRKHIRIHTDERPYPCPDCDRRFRQTGCLKNHIASQHGATEMFICYYCNKSFPIKERLRLHMRIHSGEKPYKCAHCVKTFARGGQLTQHQAVHENKLYRCGFCPSVFNGLSNLRSHEQNHVGKQTGLICDLCGKAFVQRQSLMQHHPKCGMAIKPFYCKLCDKTITGNEDEHSQTHDKNRVHGCGECGARFTQRSQLKVHLRFHSGERPYRCQVCWQAFAHSSVLKLHIRKHTGEKPFRCQLCTTEVGFSQLPHLKNHMRAIHNMDKSYMCTECKNFYKTKSELLLHNNDCFTNTDDVDGVKRETNMKNLAELSKMRLSTAILLKKISSKDRLKNLGFEKRLIDNVLVDALKQAGKSFSEDKTMPDKERMLINIKSLLDWTLPASFSNKVFTDNQSADQVLEELTKSFKEPTA